MQKYDKKKESKSDEKQQKSKAESTKENKNPEFQEEIQLKEKAQNNTGLPDNLKSGIENLSGHSLDDVKVHYNSGKPAQLNAHAYAQGNQIHLASGQEKHLAHEAWHVVQQKQGRVQPTTDVKGAKVNDDVSLEKEADVMGGKALQMKDNNKRTKDLAFESKAKSTVSNSPNDTIQGYFNTDGYTYAKNMWADAESYAKFLDSRLDLRTKRGDTYIPELKTNLESKANKAATTLVGEAYETFTWDQPKGTSVVYGPGSTSGGDLKAFESLKRGSRALTPSDNGEVKSASSINTYKDGIANAYHKRGQSYIIMYATDDSIASHLDEFMRAKINYAVSNQKLPNGTSNGKTYTFVATIELPDQGRYQYLYTWV